MLEKVTGEAVPLDPRFYAAVEATQGLPGEGGGTSVPFHNYTGETVLVTGVITSGQKGPVDIDVRVPDPSAEGGVSGKGKLLLDQPGIFELTVPIGLGDLELQAFQDPDKDGPGADDPFAQVNISVGEGDLPEVDMALVPGARGADPVHKEAAAGAAGGGIVQASSVDGAPLHKEAPAGSGAVQTDPFEGILGPRISVSGHIRYPGTSVVDIDLFRPDDNSPGGRDLIGKLKFAAGPYSFKVPKGFGPLVLEAFADQDNNGPSSGDPMGSYQDNPLIIGSKDIVGIDLHLKGVGQHGVDTTAN